MSRAFTKEIDDAPPPPVPDRPVSTAPNLVTPRGAQLIEANIAELSAEIERAAPEQSADMLRDLRYWQSRSSTMQIIERPPGRAIGFGATATIKRGKKVLEITIVGEDEADPAERMLAWTSPLARAINEAEPGESVEFAAAGRSEMIEILAVDGFLAS